jgi:hypothetical protein
LSEPHARLALVSDTTPSPEQKRSSVRVPKWESDTVDRVRTGLRRIVKPLQELCARDANEGDTRLIVTDILSDLLGYDKYSELATEYMVRGEFADYGIRIDGDLVAMVEVKRVATTLGKKHLRQVEMYGVNEGVEWLLLTNARTWQAYRLVPGMPVRVDMVLDVDLLGGSGTLAAKASGLAYLSREFMKRNRLSDLWRVSTATSPTQLAAVLLGDRVLDEARKDLKRLTGHAIETAELARLLRETVIRDGLAN